MLRREKRTYTPAGFLGGLVETLRWSPWLLRAYAGPGRLPARLREGVMLEVARANECRWCLLAHSEFGLLAGLTEEEVRSSEGPLARGDAREGLLRRLARSVAEGDGRVPGDLLSAVGEGGRSYAACAVALNFANRTGNTLDAFLARLRGEPLPEGGTLGGLALVSGFWLLGALPVGLAVAASRLLRVLF